MNTLLHFRYSLQNFVQCQFLGFFFCGVAYFFKNFNFCFSMSIEFKSVSGTVSINWESKLPILFAHNLTRLSLLYVSSFLFDFISQTVTNLVLYRVRQFNYKINETLKHPWKCISPFVCMSIWLSVLFTILLICL